MKMTRKTKMVLKALEVKSLLQNKKGEGYVDSGVKILMAVVIGALLLAGLYTLFDRTILPTLSNRIMQMFNYGG